MRRELEEELFAVDPSFYVRDDLRRSAMAFGFEHGDGWYPLVRGLVHLAKWKKDHPKQVWDGDRWRDPLPCVPDTRAAWEAWPDRVDRRESIAGIGCAYEVDSRGLRAFTCSGGRMVSKEDGRDLGECASCEGTGSSVFYQHRCERPWEHWQVLQCKEKFGGLRFYASHIADKEFEGAIEFAEALSEMICEECGAWGRAYESRGWWRTRCDVCRAKLEARKAGERPARAAPQFPAWGDGESTG